MRKEKLVEIRNAVGRKFTDLKEYSTTLGNILDNVEAVPVIVGPTRGKIEDMEFFTLPPKTDQDRMNVMAYRFGLNQLMQTNGFSKESFRAGISLGVDSESRVHMGDAVFSTSFDLEGVSYHLDIHWEENDNRKGIYIARNKVFVPRSYQVMRQFIGPQFKDY